MRKPYPARGDVRNPEPLDGSARDGYEVPVQHATRRALAGINRRFYAGDTAREFHDTRAHPWPGFDGLLPHLPCPPGSPLRVLDVGCGNGRLATYLATRVRVPLRYHGIDASEELLQCARTAAGEHAIDASFSSCDLALELDALPDGVFDCIAVIAVLHHVPGQALRRQLVGTLVDRLAPGGVLLFTAWRFDRIAALQRRRVPWPQGLQTLGLSVDTGDLEPGDELIAWGVGAHHLRYCNLLDDERFEQLTDLPGTTCVARYSADGSGGDHNEYRILRRDLVS